MSDVSMQPPTVDRQPSMVSGLGSDSGPAPRLLQAAARQYAIGNLRGAEDLCRELLQRHPDHADALHILGLVAWRRGDRQQGLEETRKAIASHPTKPQPHNSLGVMLKDLGELGNAEAAFRKAVDLMPSYADALTNLGNILCETGRLEEAEAMHRRVVELAPKYADAHNNLATVLSKQERLDEAIAECRIAVELQPTRAEFHLNLGNALSAMEIWEEAAAALQRAADLAPGNADAHANLGTALHNMGRFEQAAAAQRVAANLRPDSTRIWADLSASLVKIDQLDEAFEACRKALELAPNLPDVHNNLGTVLNAKGRLSDALAAFETAIELRPGYAKAYCNLGVTLYAEGRHAEALAAYDKAVELDPEFVDARWNKAILHLLLGEFDAGWKLYEYGLGKRWRGCLRFGEYPPWLGTPLAGRTLLVWSEQGIGDQIMFASVIPDLLDRGAKCVVEADPRLEPLIRRSFSGTEFLSPNAATASDIARLAIDYQVPLGGLCRWLRPSLARFPARRAFLRVDPDQVSMFRTRYRQRLGDRLIVGISWLGGTGAVRRARSIPLIEWSAILRQPNVGLVNLQYGDCTAELTAVEDAIGAEVAQDHTVDPLKDLDAFAAQTAAMDLVISIDNSTVHMAGALDVPVWIMLPAVPDWRWLLGRSDSPWYASARLFRQETRGDWAPVIATVARELEQLSRRLPDGIVALDQASPPFGLGAGEY